MTDTKHAPTPWMVKEGDETVITDADGNLILDTAYSDFHLEYDDKPNAAHIVKCVNMHEELVERLKEAQRGVATLLLMTLGVSPTETAINETIDYAAENTISGKVRETLKKAGAL